jgi:hypothetical protein
MRTLRPLSALAVALLVAFPAYAASNRIFMSTNGNNASDCANPLTPCLTFAGAITQVNPGGEVIAEATGGYGPLNISQAVTISGPPGVVIYSGLSVTVNAPGATVVLRGLTIDGTGAAANGINVVAVGSLFVESCVIANFSGSDTSTGSGIYFGSAGNLFVEDTAVLNNSYAGLWVVPSSGTAKASFVHCRAENNKEGFISDGGGGGAGSVTICDSVASGNQFDGFIVERNGELNLEDCGSANNGFGISAFTGGLVRVSNATVTDNATGLYNGGGTLLSRGNNTLEGSTSANGTFTSTYAAK